MPLDTSLLEDPLKFQRVLWPEISLYSKQAEIIASVQRNDETIVPAGNQLGKDFVAGFIVVWFFCSRSPCRIVTTSVDDRHLDILWAEIKNFITTSKYPLPIQVNHHMLRQVSADGSLVDLSYAIGRTVERGEGLLGHHLPWGPNRKPRSLCVYDEASGLEDVVYDTSDTWAHRKLVIGNARPCNNFFRKGVKAGDLLTPEGDRYYRKVIKIRAIDSPNVQLGKARVAKGLPPGTDILVPGLIDYQTYQKRLQLLDKVRMSWVLDAEFYEGGEVLMFPPDWLNRAEQKAEALDGIRRQGKAMGVDAAEGGDDSSWAIVDDLGLIHLHSVKTSDTADIPGQTIAFMREYQIDPKFVAFDRGGGGKQHADALRRRGYPVQTIGFGEAASDPHSYKYRHLRSSNEKLTALEERYVYKNRRAEMYGLLRRLIDPKDELSLGRGFGIPAEYTELRRQLAPIPLLYDGDGRLYLPPKSKPTPTSTIVSLKELIGRSPDDSDALCLATFALLMKPIKKIVGAI